VSGGTSARRLLEQVHQSGVDANLDYYLACVCGRTSMLTLDRIVVAQTGGVSGRLKKWSSAEEDRPRIRLMRAVERLQACCRERGPDVGEMQSLRQLTPQHWTHGAHMPVWRW